MLKKVESVDATPFLLGMKKSLMIIGALLTAALLISGPRAGLSNRTPQAQVPEEPKLPLPALDEALKAELLGYLENNYQTPEDYVAGKFKDHDIVFLGEYHRIKHDAELVQRLIPRLYASGVLDLGIEFGVYHEQPRAEALITAETYDADLARDIMLHFACYWGYVEYMDIYRAAWTFNRSLPEGAPRFRVVNLNARQDWSLLKTEEDRNDPEVMKKVWFEGGSDAFMAGVILKEFVDKGRKALVYSGSHHAFTRYLQPVIREGKVVRYLETRMGTLVWKKIGDRAFSIFLHSPWSDKNYEDEFYPVGGVIDALLYESPLRPVGFDIVGTPFGKLTAPDDILYVQGYEPFTLDKFYDGYIYTKPISRYEGVATDAAFINDRNFKHACEQMPNIAFRNRIRKKEDIDKAMVSDADIPRRFRRFY